MTEIRKSINSVLYERLASPFYGTLILSWLIWNWKIVYITFFISENKIEGTKIDYIVTNYSDINYLITFPLISTLLLLTLIPFIGNGAYWLSLKFNKWKSDKKNEVEKKQLLTLEQSIQLREVIAEQEKRFDNLLLDKNTEIKQLKLQIDSSKGFVVPTSKSKVNDGILQNLADRIKSNTQLSQSLEKINYYIKGGYSGLNDQMDVSSLNFFESNDIIENKGKGMFNLTENGKEINRLLTNDTFK